MYLIEFTNNLQTKIGYFINLSEQILLKIRLMCSLCKYTFTLKIVYILRMYQLCLLIIWSSIINIIESHLIIRNSSFSNFSKIPLNNKSKNLENFIVSINYNFTHPFDINYSSNYYSKLINNKSNNNNLNIDIVNFNKNFKNLKNINKSNSNNRTQKINNTINKQFSKISYNLIITKFNVNDKKEKLLTFKNGKNISNLIKLTKKIKKYISTNKKQINNTDDNSIIFIKKNNIDTILESIIQNNNLISQIILNKPLTKCKWPLSNTLFIIDSTINVGSVANHQKILHFVTDVTKQLFFVNNEKNNLFNNTIKKKSSLSLVQFTPEAKFEFSIIGKNKLKQVEQKINVFFR